jgi:hypothetical protein
MEKHSKLKLNTNKILYHTSKNDKFGIENESEDNIKNIIKL